MSYKLDYRDGGFTIRFEGRITADELNQGNGDIHGHDQFDYHSYQIVDLLAADLTPLSEQDAQFPALTDSASSSRRWKVKVALVVTEKHALSVVNSYVMYARKYIPHWEFEVFATVEEALMWARKEPL